MNFVNVADLKPAGSDKTYRQINAELTHQIPIGTLVNYTDQDYIERDGKEIQITRKLQLYVVDLTRDCDQTPLYTLSFHTVEELEGTKEFFRHMMPHLQEKTISLFSGLNGYMRGIPEYCISPVPESEYLVDKD